MAEAPRRVEARREPEADRAGVEGCRVDARDLHQRPQAGLLRPRERPQPGDREPPVLVDERDDVGDRRDRDEIEVPLQRLRAGAEQRLAELVDDAGAAELPERIRRLAVRADQRAVGQVLPGPVMVGDDDLEPAGPCGGDLVDRGDAAVDRQDEAASLVGKPLERRLAHAVALVEAARQVPFRVGAELAQDQDRERGRRDAVGVVIAVDADPAAVRDRGADRRARGFHVAECEGIVLRQRALEKRPRPGRVAVAAAGEHDGGRRGDAELRREPLNGLTAAVLDSPAAVVHRAVHATEAPGRIGGVGGTRLVVRARCLRGGARGGASRSGTKPAHSRGSSTPRIVSAIPSPTIASAAPAIRRGRFASR